ncbi:VOC family protein [Brasilonema sp. UFV-L1]|uniref:VOC family protein n=1 Tax=Brasilonema sp. UFV-L1 TaxID=2234130 RepID=UPI002006DEC8|nr:VOC family protein [Brasilonema sp. UFV-L1]
MKIFLHIAVDSALTGGCVLETVTGMRQETMKLGAINHIALSVSNLERSESFYNALLGFLGYEQGEKTPQLILWASPNGVITISPSHPESPNQKHDRYSPGLHHLAFSADSREDVDQLYKYLLEQRVEILDPPAEYDYLPGYYALFFLDPDGIKLELTHTPNWPPEL